MRSDRLLESISRSGDVDLVQSAVQAGVMFGAWVLVVTAVVWIARFILGDEADDTDSPLES